MASNPSTKPWGGGTKSWALEAVKPKKKNKGTKLSLSEFTTGVHVGPGFGRSTKDPIVEAKGLAHEEILRLPTGPRERTAGEIEHWGAGKKSLGGDMPRRDRYEKPKGRDMRMGAISGFWILEFLLRQRTIETDTAFFRLIPSIINIDSGIEDGYQRYFYNRLKKTILLRSLERDDAVTDRTLQTLEIIEELDRDSTTESPSSLKAAYCAVAEELTVKHLRTKRGDDCGGFRSFDDAVNVIWKCRVAELELSEAAAGLFSEQLRDKWKEMEQAVGDSVMRKRLLMSTRTNGKAFNSVLAYLDAALLQMGPSSLQIKAAEMLAVNKHTIGSPSGEAGEANNVSDGSEIFKDASDTFPPSESDHSKMNDKKTEAEAVEEVEITMTREEGSKKHLEPSTHEVLQVGKALESCCEDLHNAVKDPLHSAVAKSAELLRSSEIGSPNTKEFENRLNRIPIDAPGPSGTATGSHDKLNQEERTKRSIMERNSTAHTTEWNDSIEALSIPDESPNASKQVLLPNPKKIRHSPINMPKRTFCRKRPKMKWSVLEEDTLREAVKIYGKGNWKTILNHYSTVYVLRTDVDLKDKWRNMTR